MIRALSLQLTATAASGDVNSERLCGISQCLVYIKRALPLTLTNSGGDDNVFQQTRKRVRLSPTALNLPIESEYRDLFCPHEVQPVDCLSSRQRGHLVAVTDISRHRRITLAGITCSVMVTWSAESDKVAGTVYRSCGHITLSTRDVVNPRLGLLFNTSHVLSGWYIFSLSLSLSLRFNSHFPGEPGLAGVY